MELPSIKVEKQFEQKRKPNMVLRYAVAFIICLILLPFAAILFCYLLGSVIYPELAPDFINGFFTKS